MTFQDKLQRGEATFEDFRDAVEEWHNAPPSTGEVFEYLGITRDEYFKVVKETSSYMPALNRKYKLSVAGRVAAKYDIRVKR